MKRVLYTGMFVLYLLLMFSVCSFAQNREGVSASKKIIYLIELRQDIDKSAFKMLRDGFDKAEEVGSDYILMDISTYGGAVDAADSIRSMIIQCSCPVIAFINSQAASAGALISIACDSIYMRNGSSIGAATVVNAQGEVMPDKYQSFMRAMMRSTAESHGKKIVVKDGKPVEVWHRDPQIAQAMVSKDSVLSFTPLEAIENDYCEGMAESVEEVISLIIGASGEPDSGATEYEIVKHEITALKGVVYFLMNPMLQGLLLMLIIGGIYFELQSPGIGFPLIAALVGAVLYFAPLYLEGLVQNWELVIFFIGILLLILEIFVIPGFGVAGISGIALIVVGLAFAMIDNDVLVLDGSLNIKPLIKPFAIVLVSLTLSIFGSIYLAGKLYPTQAFSHIALKTDLVKDEGFVGVETSALEALVGSKGIVSTDLKPSGTIMVNGKRYYAQVSSGYLQKGSEVVVTRAVEGRLYVKQSV